uniref:Uncharacterized protein n=1 Tax=Solanum lycopersicum TaxID=4081 RepID=A0A3Q7INU0_SOLLC
MSMELFRALTSSYLQLSLEPISLSRELLTNDLIPFDALHNMVLGQGSSATFVLSARTLPVAEEKFEELGSDHTMCLQSMTIDNRTSRESEFIDMSTMIISFHVLRPTPQGICYFAIATLHQHE